MFPQEKEDREVEQKEQLLLRQTFSARGKSQKERQWILAEFARVSSVVCEMEAVCKTEPDQRELWKVAPKEKGLPCVMDAPTLICAPVLLITLLEYCVVIPPAQGRSVESMLRCTKPSCLSPASYETIFQHCIYLKQKFPHWLVGNKGKMNDVARPRRNALISVMTSYLACCWWSVTWPPI